MQELSQDELNNRESALVSEISGLFSYQFEPSETPPGVVSDVNFASEYADCCLLRSIPVRVLLCATDSPFPKMNTEIAEKIKEESEFIGYDFIGGGWGYSALYDDLYADAREPELAPYLPLLNDHGIFKNQRDLENYIETRKKILKEAGEKFVMHGELLVRETPLEDWGAFWECAVWEVVSHSNLK